MSLSALPLGKCVRDVMLDAQLDQLIRAQIRRASDIAQVL